VEQWLATPEDYARRVRNLVEQVSLKSPARRLPWSAALGRRLKGIRVRTGQG
jgi:hypothetical protein